MLLGRPLRMGLRSGRAFPALVDHGRPTLAVSVSEGLTVLSSSGAAAAAASAVVEGAAVLSAQSAAASAFTASVVESLAVQSSLSAALPAQPSGTMRVLGSTSLADAMTAQYSTLPGGSATWLPKVTNGGVAAIANAYCGAVIWRNRLTFPVQGGHAATTDDAVYSQDLNTGAWQCDLGTSDAAFNASAGNVSGFGEYTIAGRPAAAHTGFHLVTVGDEIYLGVTCYIGINDWSNTSYSLQAHRFVGTTNDASHDRNSAGGWQRYGNNGGSSFSGQLGAVFYEPSRGVLTRIPFQANSNTLSSIPTGNASATWTDYGMHFRLSNGSIPNTVNGGTLGAIDNTTDNIVSIYRDGMGYSPELDCYVTASQHDAPGRVWVADASARFGTPTYAFGWYEVVVTGAGSLPALEDCGLQWVSQMNCFVCAATSQPDRLYYLRPGSATWPYGPWRYEVEIFTTSATFRPWATGEADGANDPYRQINYSSMLNSLVVHKSARYPTEIWKPAQLAALDDLRTRTSSALAWFDFTEATLANGGTWKWGSPQASPKVTVWARNDADSTVGPYRVLDYSVFPPGSTRSLRYDIPNGLGERSDDWRLSIDNYADQFGAGDEFWFQWRMRMDSTWATFTYLDRYSGNPTGWKCLFINAGMQSPWVQNSNLANYQDIRRADYGYGRYDGSTNPPVGSPSQSDNVMFDAWIDLTPEIVMRDKTESPNASVPATFKQPWVYVGKGLNDETSSYNSATNKFTLRNQGSDSSPFTNATGWWTYVGGTGDVFDNWTQAFAWPANEWITVMIHVVLGSYATGATSSISSGGTRSGYANSTIEWYIARAGQTAFSLIHKRTGVVFPTDQTSPIGPQGVTKYGQFGFTTFMTNKSFTQTCPAASVWFAQPIIRAGSTPIPCPQY